MPEMLSKAIRIASQAHEGQLDKAKKPYILHPLRILATVGPNMNLMAAAVLHDVVEDTPITLDDLRAEGFCDEIIAAVDAMTRRTEIPVKVLVEDEKPVGYTREVYHTEFIPRLSENDFACIIKMKDLTDNSSDARLVNLPEDVMQRFLEKYARTRQYLMKRYIEACKKIYGGVL